MVLVAIMMLRFPWIQSYHFFSFSLKLFFPSVYRDTLHYLVQSTFFHLKEDSVRVYRQTNFRRLHRSYFCDNILTCVTFWHVISTQKKSIIYQTFIRATSKTNGNTFCFWHWSKWIKLFWRVSLYFLHNIM